MTVALDQAYRGKTGSSAASPSGRIRGIAALATAAAFVVYGLAFAPLYSVMGPAVVALSTVPVIAAGSAFGLRGGLAAAAVIAVPLNSILLSLFSTPGWDSILREVGAPETMFLLVMGAGVGGIRDLGQRLRAQAEESSRVQAALRETEEHYRAVVDNVADAIAINVGTDRVFVNKAFLKLHGLDEASQALRISLDDFVHDEDREMVKDRTLARQKGDHAPGIYEYRIRRADGEVRTVQTSATAILYNGQPAALAVLRDVTEQSVAKEALGRSEERYRSVFEGSRDSISITSKTGELVDANASALALFDYTRQEMIGLNFADLYVDPEDRGKYQRELDRTGSVKDYWIKLRKSDGTPIECLLTAAVRRAGDGSVLGYQGIIRDVTELHRAQEALRRVTRQSQLILDSTGEGIYGVDLTGSITFVNPAAAKMLRWDVHGFIGKHEHEAIHHSRPDGAAYPWAECPIHASIRDGTTQQVGHEVFWRHDGSSLPIEYISTPIREQDQIAGAVIAFRDITERLEVERMKGESVSVVSHELRTPLTSTRGSLGLLAGTMSDSLPEKGARMLQIAVENTERLVRLINDILDLERMASGKMTSSPQPCYAAELADQAVDAMRAMAEKADVTLVNTPPPCQLWADPDRIIQILTNLLSNAIKFSGPGDTVWLSGHCRNEDLVFQVRDQGRGIPSDKLEGIFGRFNQVDASDSRREGGTGLGLAICQTITTQHGGRIWAESVLGEGSTFFCALPVFDGQDEEPEAGQPAAGAEQQTAVKS